MGFFTASKLKKMKKSFRNNDLQKATVYADKIKPEEVHTAYDLSMMADIYVEGKKYSAAKRVYTEMYNRNKSVRVCKSLIELNLKSDNVKQAVAFVRELKELDSDDYERYIYQYKIGKKVGKPDDYLIACLLKVREADYIDVWALELAKLYYKTGDLEECVKECKNIKLWFSETEVSKKAEVLLEACAEGTTYGSAFGEKKVKRAPAPEVKEEVKEEAPEEEEVSEDIEESVQDSVIPDDDDDDDDDDVLVRVEEDEEYHEEEISEEELSDEDFSEDVQYDDGSMKEFITDDEEFSFDNELAKEVREISETLDEKDSLAETTATLINDTLSHDVMKALHEQEELVELGEEDEVEKALLKMIDEEDE